MAMNDRQLRYALAVWHDRSFSRAAEKLAVSQPALSEQVRNLETELGFSLFERTSRGVEPSNAGRTFLAEAKDAIGRLAALEDLANELKGTPESTFRVGVGSGLARTLVPALIESVRASNTPCRLDLITATTRRVQRLVAEKRLDIGLQFQGEIKAMPPDVRRETFAETELVLVLPQGHPLAAEDGPVTLAEAARFPLILNEPRIGYGRAALAAFEKLDLAPQIAAVSDDLETVTLMVTCGAGLALAPRIALEHARLPHMVVLRRLDPPRTIPLLLVRRDDPLQPRVEACIEKFRLLLATATSKPSGP